MLLRKVDLHGLPPAAERALAVAADRRLVGGLRSVWRVADLRDLVDLHRGAEISAVASADVGALLGGEGDLDDRCDTSDLSEHAKEICDRVRVSVRK